MTREKSAYHNFIVPLDAVRFRIRSANPTSHYIEAKGRTLESSSREDRGRSAIRENSDRSRDQDADTICLCPRRRIQEHSIGGARESDGRSSRGARRGDRTK